MKKIMSMILLTFCLSASLSAVQVIYTKKNTAAALGAAIGKGLGEGFNQSFTDAIMRQRDLEQYEQMLEIQYRYQLRAQEDQLRMQDRQLQVQAQSEEYLRYLENL